MTPSSSVCVKSLDEKVKTDNGSNMVKAFKRGVAKHEGVVDDKVHFGTIVADIGMDIVDFADCERDVA